MEDLIKKLVFAFGPSSKEEAVKKIIRAEIEQEVDEIGEDKFGNLVAHIKGSGEKLMLAAHTDSIGVIVTDIDKNGFLRFSEIGGLRKSFLVGQKILLENGIEGYVFYEDKESPWEVKEPKMEKVFIDVGATNKARAKEMVQIGTLGVYMPHFIKNDSRIIAPSMDDRIGVYILIELIKNLKKRKSRYDLFFVFTTQEEVGVKGAKTSTFEITPDLGIAVDVTFSGDTPECRPMALSLGNGPAIKVMDGGMIASKEIKDELIKTARQEKISYQLEVLTGGTTDAYAMQLTKSGVISGAVSIPTRYVHTSGETIDINDVTGAINLLKKYIEK